MGGNQLVMFKPSLGDLPGEVELPPGYGIRTYRPGDEAAWAYIISRTIGGSDKPDRCRRELIDKRIFSPDRLFFAIYRGKPVGTICAWQRSSDPEGVGYVHMLGVLKEHRGRKLGYMLLFRALQWFKEHRFKSALLHTDDFRLPAIKLYLKFGFVPLFADETHPRRWRIIGERLGIPIPGVCDGT